MKKAAYAIVPFSLVLVGLILACNFLVPPQPTPTPVPPTASPTTTQTRTPTATSTPVPPTATPTPTQTKVPTPTSLYTSTPTPTRVPTSTPTKVPFCENVEPGQSSCAYPFAEQTGAFCVKKSPYNLIALSDNASYELLHEHVQCQEAGVKDGQRNIICTGPMAYYFEIRVCDSACSSLQLEPNLAQCPFGYAYNNLQKCCTNQVQDLDQGCTVLRLRTISCTTDCGQYTTSSTCNAYGYSCRWDKESSTCRLRK
jgi:hypothetical protein